MAETVSTTHVHIFLILPQYQKPRQFPGRSPNLLSERKLWPEKDFLTALKDNLLQGWEFIFSNESPVFLQQMLLLFHLTSLCPLCSHALVCLVSLAALCQILWLRPASVRRHLLSCLERLKTGAAVGRVCHTDTGGSERGFQLKAMARGIPRLFLAGEMKSQRRLSSRKYC